MDKERKNALILGRIVALFEVLLCSDYPTQLAVGATLYAIGWRPTTSTGALSLKYVVTLSLVDTVLLVGLVVLFIKSHGERVREILLGSRSWIREAEVGIPMTLGAIGVALVSIGLVRMLLPSLHNLERNPLESILRGPRDAALFAVVVVVAGGIREEIQRAFILHRFNMWLGGPVAGVIVSSVAFGLGHRLQGNDVAVATGMLGVYWSLIYLKRRSCIAPMVSHAGFDLLELAQYFMTRS